MVINMMSIFKLSSMLSLISTVLLMILLTIGVVEVPTPAIIMLTFTSITLVLTAFVIDKKETKPYWKSVQQKGARME